MDDVTVTCQITRRVTQCGTQLIVFCGYYYVSVHIIEFAAPHREARSHSVGQWEQRFLVPR